MVLVGMAPTAMSVCNEYGNDRNGGPDGDHEAGTNGPDGDGGPHDDNSGNCGQPDS